MRRKTCRALLLISLFCYNSDESAGSPGFQTVTGDFLMSRQHQTDLECPKCNTIVTTTLWSSLNVSDDPELKDNLLNGEINLFQCTQCNREAYVAIPFLYHDMKSQFCVQYYPFESINEEDFFDNFMPDGKLFMNLSGQSIESMTYMEDIHIVFSMHELVQYVIFRDRLREAKKHSMGNN